LLSPEHHAMTRLFVPATLAPGLTLSLPAATAHRVRDVLRLRVGADLTVFDGTGGEYAARVHSCGREAVVLTLGAHRDIARESPLAITLVQGISRGERMDYTLQKAVELGVTRIVPLASARSQVKLEGERATRRLAHWQNIIVHACEQCGRNRLPALAGVQSLDDFCAADASEWRLTLSPDADRGLPEILREAADPGAAPGPASFSLVIGPEGGLAPTEIAKLTAIGYRGVRLGPRILRTETAALVALTALQILAGDLTT